MGSSDPFHVQWHITNLCNLRCRHCYQEIFSTTQDLGWEGLEKVSDHLLTTMQTWDRWASIHLTGGEPLLNLELYQLLEVLDQSPRVIELGIISNGLCFNREVVERLSTFQKLRKIKISLDGPDAKTNDAIRGKGVFRRVLENLALVEKEQRFEVILMFTVMKQNFRSLPAYVSLCQDLGVDGLILERFIPWGKGREMAHEVLGQAEWREVIETLFEFVSSERGEVAPAPYQAFQIRFRSHETELLGAPCVIGTDGVCILPDGDVLPCRRFPVPVGNLLMDTLERIWANSDILNVLKQKEALKGKCGKCHYKDCRGCRSLALALTGDYLQEDPHCWYECS